jgi:hypothetical protein
MRADRRVGAILVALLVLAPLTISAQPKQCRSYVNALTDCQAELAQYKPIVMAATTGSVSMGQSLTVTLPVPMGSLSEFAMFGHDWTYADLPGGGGYAVTLIPAAPGLARLVYRVLINGQLYEYPVEITVAP